jgi:hypothetical protein
MRYMGGVCGGHLVATPEEKAQRLEQSRLNEAAAKEQNRLAAETKHQEAVYSRRKEKALARSQRNNEARKPEPRRH